MKKVFLLLILANSLLLISSGRLSAQNIDQKLKDLQGKFGEVKVDKLTYQQSIDIVDGTKGKIRYNSVEVNEKGESAKTSYELYISDIDKNTVLRKPSGKKIFVSATITNKQKFIKFFKEDKFEAYVENIDMLVSDPDAAQAVSDLIKAAIPLAKTTEKTWTSASEALSWVKGNIGEVKGKTGATGQSFSYNEKKNYLITYVASSADSKGTTIENKYNFNILDINKSKLLVQVSGTTLSVNIELKNSDKFIQFLKNNELQSYVSSIDLLCEDIDQARTMVAALSAAIDKSKPQLTEFKTLQQATDFIKTNTMEVAVDAKKRNQKIEFSNGNGTKTTFTSEESDSKGKTISSQYDFYLSDMEASSVNFKVSGKKISIFLTMAGKSKFIKYTKDNVLQNYVEDVELLQSDIETTRELVAAFTVAIKESAVAPMKWNSTADALKFIQNTISSEQAGSEIFTLTFMGEASEPYPCTFSKNVTDAKGVATEEVYLFYPYMLDANLVKVESEGKYLSVTAQNKSKKSYIRKTKKDQVSYMGEVAIPCFDAKKAKDIAAALKYLISSAVPKEKTWNSKDAAIDFIKQSISDMTVAGKETKQHVEASSDNACKLTYTKSTTDDKGKTLEEIFEFSLSDMNKQTVDFKTQGSVVTVVIACKNSQKLVKPYKNGEQQSYSSSVEITTDDVEKAKNLTDAFKSAISLCE